MKNGNVDLNVWYATLSVLVYNLICVSSHLVGGELQALYPYILVSAYICIPMRTCRELSALWSTKRRSPYENSPPITVYLRHAVEKR